MKHKYSPVIFGVIVLLMVNGNILRAQSSNPLIHGMKYTNPDPEAGKERLKGAVEDASQRTLYSSQWKTKGGKVIAQYSSVMLNYPDANGQLQPIDLTLHSDPRGWVADKQPNACYFHSDRSTAINLGGKNEITFNKNCAINGMPLDQHIVSMEGSEVKMNLSEGVHKDL
ncbi:MAG TPA: hypothetical protein VK808_12785, partial [Bacteroidia bacterium]|nr:hypothetical protein [Bacteroidia bacterium]